MLSHNEVLFLNFSLIKGNVIELENFLYEAVMVPKDWWIIWKNVSSMANIFKILSLILWYEIITFCKVQKFATLH